MLQLPNSKGCLVCGRDNAHGLQLTLCVAAESGKVSVDYTPREQDIGFVGIVHGGILATVLDEAMVWAATWAGRRFCVCGEMTVRYRQSARVGQPVVITARVVSARPRLVQTAGEVRDAGSGAVLCTASGKYVPIADDQHRAFVDTLAREPASKAAIDHLTSGS